MTVANRPTTLALRHSVPANLVPIFPISRVSNFALATFKPLASAVELSSSPASSPALKLFLRPSNFQPPTSNFQQASLFARSFSLFSMSSSSFRKKGGIPLPEIKFFRNEIRT
jgi:hypothetical protein